MRLRAHFPQRKRKIEAFLLGQMGVYGYKLLIGDDVVVEGSEGIEDGRVSLIH